MKGVCVEACASVFTYLLCWGLPAHVFKWGRSEPCCARRPLLKKQNHTFRVLSQFNDEVFQLPSHLVYGHAHTHINQSFLILMVSAELEVIQVVAVSLGSHHCLEVHLYDLITSVDLSGQVCRRLGGKTSKEIANSHPKSSNKYKSNKHRLLVSMSVKLFFTLRKCQTGLTRHYCWRFRLRNASRSRRCWKPSVTAILSN